MERVVCPVLVGRELELTDLEDALLAANRGEGQIVLVGGEAGIGKTRLASELERRALRVRMTALSGGCSEAELALPYLPFLEAFGNYLATADLDEVRRSLGSLRRELAHLFPQLEPESEPRESGDPTQAKLRLFEAIIALLRVPAEKTGLLLVLEDLHWSDASTRELLDYLTRRLRGMRIMLLGTYRSDEMHRKHPLAHHIQAWRRTRAAKVIELEPLPPDGVAEMVQAIFDQREVSNEFRDFLYERSEGNPFVLEELLKAAIDSGDIYHTTDRWERKGLEDLRLPQTVRDTILLRMEQLGPEQVEILQTASVLGRSFSYPVLVAVSGKDDRTVQAALQASVQQQLIEEDSQQRGLYRFRHALTREAIYEDMIAPRREDLHRVAADVLTRETGTASIDLAFHLMAANRWSEAVPIGIKAAGEAERNQAFPEAAQLYERLLSRVTDAPTRAELLCRAGVAHHQASEPAKAQRYLEQGIPWFESNGQELTAAGYRIILGRCFWERAQPDVARAEYERARAVLEKAGPSEALATAYVRLAGLRMFEFEDEECLALANRAVEVAAAANVESARIWAGVFAGGALVNLGRFDEGFARMDLAYTEATARGLTEIAGNALYNGEAMRVRALRAKDALERLPLFEGLRISGRANVLELAAQCFTWQALGEPARAREPAEQALQLAQETQSHTLERVIRRDLGAAIGEQGRPQEGLRVMGAFEPALELQELVPQLRCRMRLLIDSGEVAAAEAHASTVLARPNWGPAFEARALEDTAVEVLIAASRLEDAEHIVSRVRPIDAATAPFDDRMSGRLALAKGDPASARELLVKAATAFENAGYAVEAIRTRRALADAHVAAGDLEAAKAELSAAVESSDIHGAIFNGDLARLRLAGLGVAAAPAPARPADQSQPQERVVTILFADVRGYSRLAASQAPADLVDVIASFHRWAKHEVERHHGMVDKFAGDAVMAIFNAGGARLDHTVQAVQAALAIRDKAGAAGLPVGIGIAVGPAVVGPLTSNANTSAIGEVTNLASRLQAQAAAGELLLSDEAFRRTRDWLQERSMEPSEEELNLKGLAGPVKALRLNAPRLGTPR